MPVLHLPQLVGLALGPRPEGARPAAPRRQAHVGDRLVDVGRGGRLKLKLPRLRPAKRRHDVAPPKRIIGGSTMDPARIEAARERLRREIPPRPDED